MRQKDRLRMARMARRSVTCHQTCAPRPLACGYDPPPFNAPACFCRWGATPAKAPGLAHADMRGVIAQSTAKSRTCACRRRQCVCREGK